MSRRRLVASTDRTLRLPIRMSPSVNSISRLTSFIAVVLPPPDGPTRQQMAPAGTIIDRLLIDGDRWPGAYLVTFRNSISAASRCAASHSEPSGGALCVVPPAAREPIPSGAAGAWLGRRRRFRKLRKSCMCRLHSDQAEALADRTLRRPGSLARAQPAGDPR